MYIYKVVKFRTGHLRLGVEGLGSLSFIIEARTDYVMFRNEIVLTRVSISQGSSLMCRCCRDSDSVVLRNEIALAHVSR